jgi:hypothetical protein
MFSLNNASTTWPFAPRTHPTKGPFQLWISIQLVWTVTILGLPVNRVMLTIYCLRNTSSTNESPKWSNKRISCQVWNQFQMNCSSTCTCIKCNVRFGHFGLSFSNRFYVNWSREIYPNVTKWKILSNTEFGEVCLSWRCISLSFEFTASYALPNHTFNCLSTFDSPESFS